MTVTTTPKLSSTNKITLGNTVYVVNRQFVGHSTVKEIIKTTVLAKARQDTTGAIAFDLRPAV